MERVCRKILIILVLLQSLVPNVFGETKKYFWDFSECDIKDILYGISIDTGISIAPDDTVSGKGQFKFSGDDFNEAFDCFLNECRLFAKKNGRVWTISKFSFSKENDLCELHAYDLEPSVLLEKLSRELDFCITYDVLPVTKISVHFKKMTGMELMESLALRFGLFDVVVNQNGVHFARKNTANKLESNDGFVNFEADENGVIAVDVKNSDFSFVFEKFLNCCESFGERVDFCLVGNYDVKISRCVFVAKSLKDTLRLLCNQNGLNCTLTDGIYYIYKEDSSKKTVMFGEPQWNEFSLQFLPVHEFIPFLLKKLGKIETYNSSNSNKFYAYVNNKEKGIIIDLINQMDVKPQSYVVNLKYIKAKSLLERLPDFLKKEQLVLVEDENCLIFNGNEGMYEKLLEYCSFVDVPAKRISYDLLILQFDETSEKLWDSSFSAKNLELGDKNVVSTSLGSIMNFNLNLVSTFGLGFAASLQSYIEESKAQVYADTTLHGVNGKVINFKNTNTYRYRDNNLDPETGKPIYSGVTREIVSGITIDITGWISGDGLITSNVTASISRQGNDTSGSTGNPPPTSEKIITTEVCCKNGEPIVLSGLIEKSSSDAQKRTPLLGLLPAIGNLFKSRHVMKENSEMVIYLVPHITGIEKESTTRVLNKFGSEQLYKSLTNVKELLKSF